MASARKGLPLHLHSGIPVVAIEGEWDETTDSLLRETIGHLARAGHFEIIVNLSRATQMPILEGGWLEALDRMAASIQTRYGHLNIVATMDQIEASLRRKAQSLVRWATSEEQAICRILGLPVTAAGCRVTARLDPGR
jgi:hypothetical protein